MIRGKFGVPTFRVFICALKRAMSVRVVSIVVFTVFLHCLMNNAFAATEYLVRYDKNGNPLMHPIGNHRGKTFVGGVDWAATHDERAKGAAHWRARQDLAAKFQGSTGAVSNTVVRGTVTQTVAKRTVMQNLLANARRGGRFLGRGGLGGIVAGYVLEAAYDLVKEKLAEKGYKWDDKEGDFVNPQEYTVERRSIDDNVKYGDDVSRNNGWKPCGGISSYGRNMPDVATSVYTSICQTQEVDNHTFVKAVGDAYNGKCLGTRNNNNDGSLYWYVQLRTVLNKNRAITQAEFDDIILPIADKNPTPYVNASGDGEGNIPGASKPEVYLLPGQIVQSDPYTNPQTGLPEQARWETSDDPSAPGVKSKVRETITPRPDLKPDSPEAPRAKLPEKEKDGAGKDKDGKGDADKDKKQGDTGGLCEKHPEILACQKMGEVKGKEFDDIKIPHVTDERTWQPDDFLPSDGVCPQPKTFHVMGKAFSVSYEPLCEIMRQARFIILIAFILMSAYVTFGGLRKE